MAPLACGREEPAREDPLDADTRAQLAALGYAYAVDADSDPRASGVSVIDRNSVAAGINLFNLRAENRAQLMDVDGRVVHSWSAEELGGSWHHVEMTQAGELYVIAKDGYLAKLDRDSRVLWRREMRAHHDLHVDEEEVFVLARRVVPMHHQGAVLKVIEDYVAVLNHDGKWLREVSLLPLFREAISDKLLGPSEQPMDLLHVNSLERLDRNVAGLPTKGDFLIVLRELDEVAIVDLEGGTVEWRWGVGELDRPHHSSLVDGDRILLFDNGTNRLWSRVLEMDPATNRIVWEWRADPQEKFHSATRGGAQRLANGNTLITESDRGHVFEVTRAGRIVWRFRNTEKLPRENRARAAIYRMTRVSPP